MDMATLGVAAFAFAMTCMVFTATRVRSDRCHQDCLSIAFDRAHRDPSLAVPSANERSSRHLARTIHAVCPI